MKRAKLFSRAQGFTLIEMLIAVSIFTVIIIAFIGILSVVTQVQVQSSSTAAVNQESQFLLQKLQYYIQTASIIDMPTSTSPSTLTFDVASSSLDPSYITLASGTVYLQQSSGGALQALTSNRVKVTSLSFTRKANPPGHDAVSVSYTMVYNTSNIAQAFSQLFQTSIAQVSAATFDTGVFPSSLTGEPLGNSTYQWSSINNVINFSGNNVGIDTVGAPVEPLSVNGGLQLLTTAPTTCNATYRGTLLFYSPGGSAKDSLYLCAQNASATLGWQQVY
jgi:prepilin-type N-terminal cleavage/methylation domain-containing protein